MKLNKYFEQKYIQNKYVTRQTLGLYPSLFFPIMRFAGSRRTKDRLISEETELVIEGFPRSGNTFALVAFELSQNRQVKIAHHIHAPAQIIKGVKMGIPSLVLIRDPRDAVLSMKIFSDFEITVLLKSYYKFYKRLVPVSCGFVCATFVEITQDFGKVISKVNNRFGTDFNIFINTKENIAKCFNVIEAKDKLFTGNETPSDNLIAKPSPEK